MYQTTTIETPFGEMEATATRADHVSLRGDLNVNGVDYSAHAHVELVDGRFIAYRERDRDGNPTQWDHHSVTGFRKNGTYADLSDAASRKLRDTLPGVVTEWAATPEGAALLVRAEQEHAQRELSCAAKAVEQAKQELAEARKVERDAARRVLKLGASW